MKGFSLVEILVVIAIMSALATLGVVGFRNFIQHEELQRATHDLYTILTDARSATLASEYGDQYGVYIEPSRVTRFRGALYDPQSQSNQATYFSGVALQADIAGGNTVLFEKQTGSTAGNGTITLTEHATLASTTSNYRPRRERWISCTQFGCGRPSDIVRHDLGTGSVSSFPTASRSRSSMTCWVPTRREWSRPERIHRRIVSGSRPTRRAASGTVSIVEYYNIVPSQRCGRGGSVCPTGSAAHRAATRGSRGARCYPAITGGAFIGATVRKLSTSSSVSGEV